MAKDASLYIYNNSSRRNGGFRRHEVRAAAAPTSGPNVQRNLNGSFDNASLVSTAASATPSDPVGAVFAAVVVAASVATAAVSMHSDRVLRPAKSILIADHGPIEKDYHATGINQRQAIHFVYINVMNCPDTDEWASCDGTICNILKLINISHGSYGTVKHVIHDILGSWDAGQEYVGDRQAGMF